MTLRILKPGLQTTVQAGPRTGQRHLGVPASGAADSLSLALANRLVGNAPLAPALETTLTGVTLRCEGSAFAAVTGARAKVRLNGERVKRHRTLVLAEGDELDVGPAKAGARNYVAFAGGIVADAVLGSASTYLPAGFGGFRGRALRAGDVLACAGQAEDTEGIPAARDRQLGAAGLLRRRGRPVEQGEPLRPVRHELHGGQSRRPDGTPARGRPLRGYVGRQACQRPGISRHDPGYERRTARHPHRRCPDDGRLCAYWRGTF